MHSPQFIEEMKQALEARQQQLNEDIAGLLPHTEVGEDYDENATEIQMDEVNQDLLSHMKSDLLKIDAALNNINLGTYGVDSDGNDIPEDRLRAIPWADQSI